MAHQGSHQGGDAGCPPLGINPEIKRLFDVVDKDRSGKINATELKAVLVNSRGEHFSDAACNLLIGMFDADCSGTIEVNEFEMMYAYINQWLAVFKTHARTHFGRLNESELMQAFVEMGFRFSPDFVKFLVFKSDPKDQTNMSVEQFIVLCVQIHRFTEAFRARDTSQTGQILIGFEDFLNLALSTST